MNAKQKRLERRNSTEDVHEAVTILLREPLTRQSAELSHLLKELKEGRDVLVKAQLASSRHKAGKRYKLSIRRKDEKSTFPKFSFSNVATALSGGAALGLSALALAPASAIIASVVAVLGVGISGVLTRVIDKSH